MQIIQPKQTGNAVYRQLSDSLRDTIARNSWPAHTQLPNVKKIAAASGVSLRTADRAVQELVKAGICYRRPKQGTFVARPLGDSEGRRRVILMYSVFSSYECDNSMIMMRFLDGLQRIASENGVTMIPIYGDLLPQLEFYTRSKEVKLLGTVFTDTQNMPEKIAALQCYSDLPFALINYRLADFSGHFPNLIEVYSDEAAGGAWAAEYLWKCGHRKIALVNMDSGSHDLNYDQRINGFLRRYKELGGSEHDLIFYYAGRDEVGDTPSFRLLHSGAKIFHSLQNRFHGFTALFCVEDAVAAGAAMAGGENRPEVIGYDRAIPYLSDIARIPSVAVNYSGMSYRAGELLLENSPNRKPVVLPVRPHLPDIP